MKTAQISTDGTHQIVILPQDFQVSGTEVYVKRVGDAVILLAKDDPWRSLVESLDQFSDDFDISREQLPLDTREEF